MIAAHSHRGRRLLARLDRGTDLIGSVIDLCRVHAVRSAVIRGSGWLEEAELQDYDQQELQPQPGRRIAAPAQLVHLNGSIAEHDGVLTCAAQVLLSRETDNGIQVLGGQVVSAKVFVAELVIDVFDDLILRRGIDPQTGVLTWIEILAEAPPAAEPDTPAEIRSVPAEAPRPAASTPAPARPEIPRPKEVARPEPQVPLAVKEARIQKLKDAHLTEAAPLEPPRSMEPSRSILPTRSATSPPPAPIPSAKPPPAPAPAPAPVISADDDEAAADWDAVKAASASRTEEEEAAIQPKRGDIVEHATFGRCTIERVEEMQERVSVRVRSGRVVQLSLEYLSLEPIGREGGVRIFRAVKRR